MPAGVKRARAEDDEDFAPRRSLDDCKDQIRLNNKIQYDPKDNKMTTMPESAFNARVKAEFWNYQEAGSMRVDVCDTCHNWDYKITPPIKNVLGTI